MANPVLNGKQTIMSLEYTNENSCTLDITDAEYYKEETYKQGKRIISKATDSHVEHEGLYILKTGEIILRHWSDLEGVKDTRCIIIPIVAAMWFSKQEYPKDLIPVNIRRIMDLCKI